MVEEPQPTGVYERADGAFMFVDEGGHALETDNLAEQLRADLAAAERS